jgi:essential nuclear protein 1
MPKASISTSSRQGRRHNPLEDDLLATGLLRNKAPKQTGCGGEGDEEHYVDAKASKQILKLGRELAEENDVAPPRPAAEFNAFGFDSRFDQDEAEEPFGEDEEVWGDDDEVVEEIEIEPEDLETYNKFLQEDEDPLLKHGWGGQAQENEGNDGGTNLADIILAKIAAHESGQGAELQEVGPVDEDYELPPKVVEVYTK